MIGFSQKITYIQLLREVKKIDFNLSSPEGREVIDKLLNDTVLESGKRLRPMLVIIFSKVLGLSDNDTLEMAKCIEFVHSSSLAHDDVIDNATTRRGKPSINMLGSNKKAILAGDYLLSETIVRLSKLNNVKVIESMANTIRDLSCGEWLQSDLINNRKYQDETLEEVSLLKTSSVIKWCVCGPLLFANKDEKSLKLAQEFGNKFGLAFQYIDDCLDYKSTSNKDNLLDLKNNQLTKVTYEYFQKNQEDFKKYKSFEKNLDEIEFDAGLLEDSIKHVYQVACDLLDDCKVVLNELFETIGAPKEHPYVKVILQLCDELKTRNN